MQIEITLKAEPGADYQARDLGFLLHKHPDHLHERTTAAGTVSIFFPEADDASATAVLHLEVDPVGLVRGRNRNAEGLLDQYVSDRAYVANSFLSVALGRCYGQSMSGRSKERQALADRALCFEARVVPVAASGGPEVIVALFEPLGYAVTAEPLDETGQRGLYDLRLSADIRLRDPLNHLYVLVPVLDDAKHWWIDRDEIDKLIAKGGGWLAEHPAKELITKRALKHRRGLVHQALARLAEETALEEEDDDTPAPEPEKALEKPIRLHELRLEAVMAALRDHGVASVLDLGCGDGKLLRRLVKERGIDRIVGVDPSVRALEIAARRLYLDRAGEGLRRRIDLQMGSLTYGDRRWQGFDAAAGRGDRACRPAPALGARALGLWRRQATPRRSDDAQPRIQRPLRGHGTG
jgi:3' terminal RNA ribose 2'-O-methyltransferase Hen1